MEAATARKETASSALRNPISVQILTVANEGSISPRRFVDEALRPRPRSEKERKNALSQCSYYFRTLHKAGALKIVDELPRRGAVEHVYEGTARAYFSDEGGRRCHSRSAARSARRCSRA